MALTIWTAARRIDDSRISDDAPGGPPDCSTPSCWGSPDALAENFGVGGDQEEKTPIFGIGDVVNRTRRDLVIIPRFEHVDGHMAVPLGHVKLLAGNMPMPGKSGPSLHPHRSGHGPTCWVDE